MKDFLRIKGRNFVFDGNKIRLRGFNVGNWLNIEGYMMGLPFTDSGIRQTFAEVLGPECAARFFRKYQDCYFTAGDARFIAEKGFNLLRLPFNYRLFESDMKPGRYNSAAFAVIDKVMRLCRKYRIFLLLDLHAAPGSQSEDLHSDNCGVEARFWAVRDFQDRAVALWRAIAARYRNERYLMGYDLLNEPNTTEIPVLNDFYRRAIRAIRSVDGNHIIVLEGNRWSDEIESLNAGLFDDPQVMAEFHHYPFHGIDKYPGRFHGRPANRNTLLSSMANKFRFFRRIKRPLLLGEFGFTTHPGTDGPYQLIDALLDVADEHGWHWVLWSFKDVGPMGLIVPKRGSPWQKFIRRNRKRRNVRTDWRELWRLMREVDKAVPDAVKRAAAKQVSHGLQRLAIHEMALGLGRYPDAKIASMPKAFLFKNCRINNKAMSVLAKHL